MASARLVHDIGINDADYSVYPVVNGKQAMCPYYMVWKGMIERCYSKVCHKKHPTYVDCSVSEEWLTFSNFKSWMETQDWKGKQLDKDILIPGNKVYSREACVFVSSEVNSLMIDCAKARGQWPVGVHFHKIEKKFRAQVSIHGKRVQLGRFKTSEDAYKAYVIAKTEHVRDVADTQPKGVMEALYLHADILEKSVL